MDYRTVCLEELDRTLFASFVRRQVVTKCWRREMGAWVIRDDPFVDDWSEADYHFLAACLQETVRKGGVVYGAFDGEALKGFASVEPELFGGDQGYMDLSSIHVSADARGRGTGKALLRLAADWAREHGGQKLYISAHSAVETQAFYRAMGCVEAAVYHQGHVEREPFDCQLEYALR